MTGSLSFDGRVAVVTGAGRGLGAAYARHLAERGAGVVVNDLGCDELGVGSDHGPADRVVEEIRAAGGKAIANYDRIGSPGTGEKIVEAALEAFGHVDTVVSNAALSTHQPVSEMTRDTFVAHIDHDPIGPFDLVKAAWPSMEERGYGRFVFISSSAQFGGPLLTGYGTAKAATWGLARCIAAAGEKSGIFSNTVAPFGFSRMIPWNQTLSEAAVEARRRLLPTEGSVPLVLLLAHEACPANGGLFVSGGGRTTQVRLVETEGFHEEDLSPESLLERWAEVTASTTPDEIDHRGGHPGSFHSKIPGWTTS